MSQKVFDSTFITWLKAVSQVLHMGRDFSYFSVTINYRHKSWQLSTLPWPCIIVFLPITIIISKFHQNSNFSLQYLSLFFFQMSQEWACSLIAQLVKNLPAMQETPVQFLGWEDPLEKRQATHSGILGLSKDLEDFALVAQLVKNLPPMQETWVRSLGWEDSLEKGKATDSSILAWRIPWTV